MHVEAGFGCSLAPWYKQRSSIRKHKPLAPLKWVFWNTNDLPKRQLRVFGWSRGARFGAADGLAVKTPGDDTYQMRDLRGSRATMCDACPILGGISGP